MAAIFRRAVETAKSVPEDILSPYREYRRLGTRPSMNGYVESLELVHSMMSKAFIVIDALDELSDNETSIADLVGAIKAIRRPIKVLVTSRALPRIRDQLLDAIEVEVRARDEDIRRFCQVMLEDRRMLRLKSAMKADNSLQEQIISSITSKAKGM